MVAAPKRRACMAECLWNIDAMFNNYFPCKACTQHCQTIDPLLIFRWSIARMNNFTHILSRTTPAQSIKLATRWAPLFLNGRKMRRYRRRRRLLHSNSMPHVTLDLASTWKWSWTWILSSPLHYTPAHYVPCLFTAVSKTKSFCTEIMNCSINHGAAVTT